MNCSTFDEFLQHSPKNVEVLENIISSHQNDIVKSFGGLSNMIQLSLTNPNAANYIDVDMVKSTLNSIMNIHHKKNNKQAGADKSSDIDRVIHHLNCEFCIIAAQTQTLLLH